MLVCLLRTRIVANPLQIPIAPSGEIIAEDVSYEDFLEQFAGESAEWVYGKVVRMSPVDEKHNDLSVFLILLFTNYLTYAKINGRVFHNPMVMRISEDALGRSPDIQVVLPDNPAKIEGSQICGAADLVIEIISPGSHRRDRVEKFSEYEKGGIKEYWIIDPVRKETLFYQLNEVGEYDHIYVPEGESYQSKVLDRLVIEVDIFWRVPLPNAVEIAEMVQTMLKDKAE